MITREQLELAAKAAGINLDHWIFAERHGCPRLEHSPNRRLRWSPLTDHGQLLDLAMACGIKIDPNNDDISYFLTEERLFKDWRVINVDCQDFPALAEAVITAAAEQQQAKETKE